VLDALVVDPELQSRLNFKQVAREVGVYRTMHFASTLREGLERLNSTKDYGVLYLSARFDAGVVREFIPAAKRSPRGQDAAFLLVVQSGNNEPETLARAMASGVDGVLIEPYSVDALRECTQLAVAVRGQRLEARYRSAVNLLVQSSVAYTDEAWKETKIVGAAVTPMKRLAAIREDVERLPAAYQVYYHEQLIERTIAAQIPQLPHKPSALYKGSSSRVKARLVRRGL